ncbi:hypothetical protein D9M72_365540 [compost metagenome]
MNRQRVALPVGQHLDEFAAFQQRLGGEGDALRQAEAREHGRHVGVALVDRHAVGAVELDVLVALLELVRVHAPGGAREVAHDVVALLDVVRMLRRTIALDVGRRGHGDEVQGADAARHQRLVAEFAGADHAVDVVADQVDGAVAHAQVDLDVGVAVAEAGQVGQDDLLRHRGAHVDAQPPRGVGLRIRHAGFHVVEVVQQPRGALEVGGAVGRDGDAPGRAVEQLHAQARFQRLDLLGDGALGQGQRVGGTGEGAGFDHADKDPHCLDLIHRMPVQGDRRMPEGGGFSHKECAPTVCPIVLRLETE